MIPRSMGWYSLGSVYLFHIYITGQEQPGIGWNYQTIALMCMLWGRYVGGDNWRIVAYFRRVECPGTIMVLINYFMFRKNESMQDEN